MIQKVNAFTNGRVKYATETNHQMCSIQKWKVLECRPRMEFCENSECMWKKLQENKKYTTLVCFTTKNYSDWSIARPETKASLVVHLSCQPNWHLKSPLAAEKESVSYSCECDWFLGSVCFISLTLLVFVVQSFQNFTDFWLHDLSLLRKLCLNLLVCRLVWHSLYFCQLSL